MIALTSVSMSVGGLNNVDCRWGIDATGLWTAGRGEDERWRFSSRPDAATSDVLKTGDGGGAVDTICSSGLQWVGEELQLPADNLTNVSRLSFRSDVMGVLTVTVYNM